ncbi:MAG: hypothetical protein SVV80_12010, partial [Planctomycetota bacterium]|nr:hypothetical protein [Planctomycetota bacterium]
IRRLIHRLRWWVKSLIWPDDKRNRFMLDVYSGDIRGDEANWGSYGNSPFGDPYFAELQLPEIKALSEQIRQVVPEGKKLLELIESTWLCAPKVFRYVEKLILQIGSLGSKTPAQKGESILQCEDTLPDFASHRQWYASFVTTVKNRLTDANHEHALFGAITPVKHWLVRLLGLKLKLYEEYNNFGKLVAADDTRVGQPAEKTGDNDESS